MVENAAQRGGGNPQWHPRDRMRMAGSMPLQRSPSMVVAHSTGQSKQQADAGGRGDQQPR